MIDQVKQCPHVQVPVELPPEGAFHRVNEFAVTTR
jgi:hypothetical protein